MFIFLNKFLENNGVIDIQQLVSKLEDQSWQLQYYRPTVVESSIDEGEQVVEVNLTTDLISWPQTTKSNKNTVRIILMC